MGMVNPWKNRQESISQELRCETGWLANTMAEMERSITVWLTDSSSIIAAESKKSGLSSALSRLFLDGGYKTDEPESAISHLTHHKKVRLCSPGRWPSCLQTPRSCPLAGPATTSSRPRRWALRHPPSTHAWWEGNRRRRTLVSSAFHSLNTIYLQGLAPGIHAYTVCRTPWLLRDLM